jgi:hypothetical protein
MPGERPTTERVGMAAGRRRPAYQEEVGPDIRRGIWDRGHIEPWELLRIVAWKSAKGLPWLALERPEKIVAVTREVCAAIAPYSDAVASDEFKVEERGQAFLDATCQALGPRKKATGLRSLRGIELPVATAVLAVLNPAAWPVIDRWAVLSVFEALPRDATYRLDVYRQYVRRLAEIQRLQFSSHTIHAVDQRAMRAAQKGTPPPFVRVAFGPSA